MKCDSRDDTLKFLSASLKFRKPSVDNKFNDWMVNWIVFFERLTTFVSILLLRYIFSFIRDRAFNTCINV